ncbi:hypothetical protein [Staphylococcus caprae]|uniref:hypothetical protein n=1 Tax=Staphylococcus caprae TaxID=29380 RepID=UPI000CD0F53D|nr:hypothetical protein [Staphylococcus caprae]POA06070.1 hypothetical protein CD155_03755 [Staphylococcus caprae]SUL89863.1 Uncharacterised protein [Staphylococcus caprae]
MILNLIQLSIKDATHSMYLKDRGTLYFSDDQQSTYMIMQHIDVIKSILQKIQTNPNIEVFVEQDIAKEINHKMYLIENIGDLRVYEPFQVKSTNHTFDDEVIEKHMVTETHPTEKNNSDEHDKSENDIEKDENEYEYLIEEQNSSEEMNEESTEEDNKSEEMNEVNTEELIKRSPEEELPEEKETEVISDDGNQNQQEDDEDFEPLSIQEILKLISELDNYKNRNKIESVGEMLAEQMTIHDKNTGEVLPQKTRESIFKGVLLYLFKDRHVNGLERTMENSFNQFEINEILKESFKSKVKSALNEMDEQSLEYFIYNHFYQVIRDFDYKTNHFTRAKRN